ncbi:HK97 gp10 family phage protein [Clostridium algidicarnis]|uniref:HK97 gp10 family phage protein n=1 Tax=Clostridium algidicarnis TaxID=37659 RepID=UPI001C0B5D26|nr:HK97 gp10 family phage protein [Clostridium algidicarnis]MBU3203124.1 HK97 gp10 family phage protein [Clostridium algidicarnis]MBU3211278.1 HK97 gp10 family phage protein [Clostridium algidicarnis]MBU3222214.1 HK97 gp10 family phage protein [Clostridium algidicarnis]
MSKMGSFDYSEFKNMANSFNKALDERVIDRWIQEFLLEMAFRAERKIKKRTPVGVYHDKTGGHLRRNWQVGEVVKQGSSYMVEIFNNVEYASYVEYGHRTRDHKSWVEGRFMATISMQEIERELPKFLEKKQVELLNQILNGR